MESAATGTVAHQRINHLRSELIDQFAHPRRCCALTAIDSQEGLGHGDGNLAGFESYNGAIAANDVEVVPLTPGFSRATSGGRGRRNGNWPGLSAGVGLHEGSWKSISRRRAAGSKFEW